MTTVSAAASDQTTELLQKLSLDSQTKPQDAKEVTKKILPNERSVTPLLREIVDQSGGYVPNGYQPLYYGVYNGSINEWDEYTKFSNHNGVDMPSGIYGDVYHHGYGYAPYSPYPSPSSPVPALGHDGQLYGAQQYQYSGTFYQQPTVPSTPYMPNQPPTSRTEISASANQPALSVDATKANSNIIANGNVNRSSASASLRASHQNSSLPSNHSYGRGALSSGHSGYQDRRFGYDSAGSPFTWFDGPGRQHRPLTAESLSSAASHNNYFTSTRNQNNRPGNFMGYHTTRPTFGIGSATPGFNDRMYPNSRMYSQYGSALSTNFNSGSNDFNSRANVQWGLMGEDKYKPTGRGSEWYSHANENLYASSELNRGPRAGRYNKNPKEIGSVTVAVKGQNLASIEKEDCSSVVPEKEQYNREDFFEEYSAAKFFIIKSYSEDDIHKSIKYSVWASTPNGNKKLDAALQESKGKVGGCPVFLFFSVNTSGQFVGLAEMVGSVDFDKTVDYWQQDKWTGCFSVKWHIVKDVPNSILRHITLENNDNKPVTNSRDTQEVKLEQGLQMLKIFKEHASKTSILDDFAFYENREKIMLEKKSKQFPLPKQVSDGKVAEGVEKKGGATDGKHSESVCIGNKEGSQIELPEQKPSEENPAANEVAGDALKPVNGKLA